MALLQATPPPGTSRAATERWVLCASVVASGMAFIDATALNVALPSIQAELRASGTDLLWIVNAYALVVAALLLLGGSLGDRFGRRRALMVGVAVFAAASVACGLADTSEFLIAARAVQGLGAALMLPGSLSLLSTTFDPSRRGRAIGIWSALSVVMTALGPLLGGLFAQAGWWRGVFFINAPLAVLCLAILRWKVPQSDRPSASKALDLGGGLLSVAGLAALSYGLIESTDRGWRDVIVLAAVLAGIGCIAAFVCVERRTAAPLLPLAVFRDRTLVAASVMTLCLYSGVFGMSFFLSLNLIQVQGYAATAAGLAQAPMMVLVLLVSPLAGYLVDRVGARVPLIAGGCLAATGFALLAAPGITAGAAEYAASFLPPLLLLGLGLGLCVAPLSTAIMNSVEQQRLGIAAGMNATLSRLSSVLGVAVLGPLALHTFQGSLISQTTALELSTQQVASLRSESADFADAEPPTGLSQDETAVVAQAIKQAFVVAFRIVSIASAVAVGAGTIVVVLLMMPRAAVKAPP